MRDAQQQGPGVQGEGLGPRLDVVIVGGGIIGVITALGLLHRGIRVRIYERAAQFHELGTAIGFTGVARECMQRLDPRLLEVLEPVSQKQGRGMSRYWDGFHPRTKQEAEREETSLLFEVPEHDLAFWGCVRSQFLLGMVPLLPEGTIRFGKQLVGYADREGSEKVVLRFADGSTAESDVVIGCDGIHSATRNFILGADHPASSPRYTHKTVFRALVPFPSAITAFGPAKAHEHCFHLGPDAHILSFPVNHEAMYNIVIAVHDPQEWQDPDSMTVTGTRDQVSAALQNWGPHIADVVQLLPETLIRYGVFDMADHPAPTYASGRVCVAGDAAHASSPWHGAGAGMGVEDALVLAELLAHVQTLPAVAEGPPSLAAALRAFSAVRMERTRWCMQSSRDMGDICEWRYPDTGQDRARIKAEFERRARTLWDFDVDGMVTQAIKDYERRVSTY